MRIAILASTNGSDIPAVLDAIESGELEACVEVIITNKECGAYELAKERGLDARLVLSKGKEREEYDREVDMILEEKNVELVVLIGYMRYLSKWFVDKYAGRIINIHPSLLPAFAGGMDKNVHEAVLERGVKVTGCTLHFVDEGEDTGPIIIQKTVEVLDDDTPETLKKKVQALEQRALIEGIALIADEMIEIRDGRVLRRL